jgi:hypothetical protein
MRSWAMKKLLFVMERLSMRLPTEVMQIRIQRKQ